MEDKVHKAKTIEFESDTAVDGPKKVSDNVKATMAEGNKGNFTMEFIARARKS